MLYASQTRNAVETKPPTFGMARGSEAEVAQIFEKLAGKKPSRSLVTSLQLATDGDPVFLVEIIRRMLIDEELREFDGVADAGFDMPAGCRDLLAVASVIGKTFDPGRGGERHAASQETAGPAFREESEYSTIRFQGKTATVQNSKGLRYLAELLRRPGEAIHVAELVRAGHPSSPASGQNAINSDEQVTVAGLGDAGEILDPRARAEYRRRLDDLEGDLEEATRWGDIGRATRAREEIDCLSQQLASAYGIGGRSRKAADSADRIRKAVTNRVRHAISRIERAHPALGAHLAKSVRTGTFCSYAPKQPVEWRF